MKKVVQLTFLFLLITSNAFAQDVLSLLNELPDIKATETTTPVESIKGLQKFSILITQPIDHFNPSLGTFTQRIILHHRGFDEPVIFLTSGYKIYSERLGVFATMFETNQIQVEYRFFGESLPETLDWKYLTTRQSAEDFHHIVQVFKKLYTKKWVSSGTSKGGETAIHNRRFYPNDVDGTIANVAPISISKNDTRYADFLSTVGGEKYAECRSNLKKFQQILLENRDYYMSLSQSEFKLMGSKENAFNLTVNELIGVFWQYTNPEDKDYGCNAVAEAIVTRDDLKILNLIGSINHISNYDDTNHSQMLPYYIHSSYELGYPEDESSHIQHFFTKKYDITSLIPPEINLPYSNATAIDTLLWLEKDAQRIMLVYGEFDSWTAGAVTKVKDNADNHRYVVKGGNHSAYFMDLPEIEKNEYISILSKWLNKTPVPTVEKSKPVPTMEDELKHLRIRY